ncbi:MAG: hypothetical protein KKC19_03465 [Nanoarchaeota archaeon]|nr:hypothetical protein [Nanoarchaeota archaeon]
MKQLELMAYESPRASEQRQEVYVVSDLESLSATYLSYGTGSGSGSSSGSGGSLGFGIVKTPYQKGTEKGPSGGGPKLASIGTFSDFKPASDFGIGPGLVDTKTAREFLERYRAGEHENYGEDHVNLDIISPVTKKHLLDIHINFDND